MVQLLPVVPRISDPSRTGTGVPLGATLRLPMEQTYPTNLRAVTHGVSPLAFRSPCAVFTFKVLRVTNSHCAFCPSGVLSAFHVLRAMLPSCDPVARTPRREYSRSRKAKEVIGGYMGEPASPVRSREVMGRALMVCSQRVSREHVAIYP